MKKTLIALLVVFGIFAVSSPAQAVLPTIDGLFTAPGEWDNAGFTYYLNAIDPNEEGVIPDAMDIFRVTLLQELDPAFGGTGDGDPSNDGVYLMVQTWATPLTLEDPDGSAASTPSLFFTADFLGDGVSDPFNLFMRHFNGTPFNGINDPAADVVEVCLGDAASCTPLSPLWSPQAGVSGVGPFTGVSANSRLGGILYEYYFPTTAFSTPPLPFPQVFTGCIDVDLGNTGANSEDDHICATLIPEPGTMFLFGSGLFGVLGLGLKRFLGKK